MLLAVDLGLRTAWSLWDIEGHLAGFGSRHFPNRSKFKAGVPTILRGFPEIEVVVAEGDARLAKVWFGYRKDWETELVQAHQWRKDTLNESCRRSGNEAKSKAIEMARALIRQERAGPALQPNHDTAEAILLGYWAVSARGWRYSR